jgi:serine O-acetyltransferase
MLRRVRRDFDHYRERGAIGHLGFWSGAAYRVASYCRSVRPAPVRIAMSAAAEVVNAPIRFFRGVEIPAATRIGAGLVLHHPHNVVVSAEAVIGVDCTLYQDVSITEGGRLPGAPTLGDRVTVFAGAKILGGVTIGDDVEVGANAVVTADVPADSVVASPTGRPIPRATIEKMRRGTG